MKIALVQPKLGELMAENFDKALCAIEQAAKNGANVICFPEIHLTPFFPQYEKQYVSDYVLSLDSPYIKAFQQKCKELGVVALPNVYLKEQGRCYDASLVILPDGSISGISTMVHITQAACFYEQDYYSPSSSGFKVYETPFGKIGIVICFDRHFPESIRSCALQGAQLIVIPTANTKAEPMEMFEWELRIPAMQNGLFIAMCNRVGKEGQMDFSGESLLVAPDGNVVVKADDQEQILYGKLDLNLVEHAQLNRPYLTLRRADMYLR